MYETTKNLPEVTLKLGRGVNKGGAGVAIAPPYFGRIEGAAGQRRRAALLLAPPRFLDFATCLHMACLVDPGASFDTPGTPGGALIVEI